MTQNLALPKADEGGNIAYYEGRMSRLPPLMVGKIFLTPKYLGFHSYEVRKRGLFGRGHLAPSGKVLTVAMDKVVDVSIESGVRAKKSRPNWEDASDFEKKANGEKVVNDSPRPIDSKERYTQLMVTCETENGLEVAMFEVADPQALADSIDAFRAKPWV